MKRQWKKLLIGVALCTMAMCLVSCKKETKGAGTEEAKIDVDASAGDAYIDNGTDDIVNEAHKVTLDKYIGGLGKDITHAGYKYVGCIRRGDRYIVKYVTYEPELEIHEKLMELQGSNIAKILIKNDKVGLGYEIVGDNYKFNLTSGSVYMNFELVDSIYVFEKYRYEDVKKIREMGELHSIPISKLQIDHVYCFAEFDEAGNTIIKTDNFSDATAQDMLDGCTVVDFYYEYTLN